MSARTQHILAVLLCAAVLAHCRWQLALDEVAMAENQSIERSRRLLGIATSGVPDAAIAELRAAFFEAARRLKQLVLHPPGTPTQQAYRAARTVGLLDQVDRVRQALGVAASSWVGRNVPRAVRDGRALGERQLVGAGVAIPRAGVGGRFNLIDVRTVQVLARQIALDAAQDLQRAADAMAQTAKVAIRRTAQQGLSERQVNEILIRGVIEGTPGQTTRELAEALRAVHGGQVVLATRTGGTMSFDVRHYAEIVARTRTREASVIARHERLREAGQDLVRIVGRISTNPCTAFLGMVFSLSGTDPTYPPLSSLPGNESGFSTPPFHVNCSKSTAPFLAHLANAAQLRAAEGPADAAKLLGTSWRDAGRKFKDLQLHAQVRDRYPKSVAGIFNAGSKAG